MSEHLNDYSKIRVDLQNLDVKIEDEDKALLLLDSLPDTYEHLNTALLYVIHYTGRKRSTLMMYLMYC